eukprot:comp10903_c0_seq1/m.5495 comp10903_c0_seq1/g.5495  ORF comp10903_c0_seq1/g.5495 comp10903_c0_seq1/m.5495 type:complete len:240 (-) comp10903_c0_seq1:191-910(-)
MGTLVRRPHSASAPCLSSPYNPGVDAQASYQTARKDDGGSIESEVHSPSTVMKVLTKVGRGFIRVSGARKVKPERPIIEHLTLAQEIGEDFWNQERLEVVYEREKNMLRNKRRLSQDQQRLLLSRQKETIEEAVNRAKQDRETMQKMLAERKERIRIMERRLEQVNEERCEAEMANEELRESLVELETRKRQLEVEVAERERLHDTEKRNAEKMMSDFLRLESEKADLFAQLQAVYIVS